MNQDNDCRKRRKNKVRKTLLGILITLAGFIIVVYGLLLIFPDLK